MPESDERPDPQELLSIIKLQEKRRKGGVLKIFFGMSAGVGKTFAMLREAHDLVKEGVDLVVGVVETHGRKETEQLVQGLEIIPLQSLEYRGHTFKEMDLDLILKRKPKLVLVDELGHSNIVGSRHPKRWQDVMEILDAGIDVYTTLNVQHLESRKDSVEGITGITIHETVPDLVLDRAVQIELIDIPPTELLKRLREGKVYLGGQSEIAAQNFFQEDRLTALRELALRFTAEKVEHDLHEMMTLSRDFGTSWKTTERLMVGVGCSPYSQQLIRTTRRLAFTLDAPWIACYVDTGDPLTEEDREILSSNLSLARDLGGEVITVTDPDVSKTLLRIAKQKNVTQIIIGRTKENFWELFFRKTLLDRIISQKNDIDIHVVHQVPLQESKRRKRPLSILTLELSNLWRVFALILGIFMVGQLTKSFLDYKTIGYVFLVCIMSMGLFVRRNILLFIAILSGLIWYFAIAPAININGPLNIEDIVIFSLFILSALVIGGLRDRMRKIEWLLRAREEKTQALYSIVKEIANARSSSQLLEGVKGQLENILKGRCEVILMEPDKEHFYIGSSELVNDEKEKAVAYWAFKNGKLAGWSTDILPAVKNLYVPLKSYRDVVGVLVFAPEFKRKLSPEEINLLQTVSQHLANYLWRTYVEEKAIKSEYLSKIERIHSSILKSLPFPIISREPSFEPATDISGTEISHKAMQQIRQSSENLQRLVINLLTMTKLNSDFSAVKKKPESVQELIKACTTNLAEMLVEHPVETEIEEDVPLVEMDLELMELLLGNILINSAENSPPGSPITIHVQQNLHRLIITISDKGKGIPTEELDKIFEKFYRIPGSQRERAGLGLAIAKNIVEAHQGKIWIRNRAEGGTEAIIDIPIQAGE